VNKLSVSLLSYQLSKPSTHSQIIIATIKKAESHSNHNDLPAAEAEITPERFPRALLFAAADAILVIREPVSVGPRGRWTVAVVRGIDNRADAATLILIHPMERRQSDTEQGSGGDQTLNVEGKAQVDRRANVE
jgi:hypothetical protein